MPGTARGLGAAFRILQVTLLLWALALVAVAGPAQARDVTQAERAELTRTVARFDAAMRGSRAEEIIGVLPPRMYDHLANLNRVDPAVFRKAVAQQAAEVMKTATFRSFGMDLSSARVQTLRDGTPYLLIPTETVIEVNSRAVQTRSNTLAMMDGGAWYLLDLGQPARVALFTQVYPEFAGVEFGGKTMKAVP